MMNEEYYKRKLDDLTKDSKELNYLKAVYTFAKYYPHDEEKKEKE